MPFLALLLLVGSLHGFFLAAVLLISSRRRITANTYLTGLLAIISGYLFESYLLLDGLLGRFPHLSAVFVPLFFLLGPLFYAYVRASDQTDWAPTGRDFLHALPALVVFLTVIPHYIKSGEEKRALIEHVDPAAFRYTLTRGAYYAVNLLQSAAYVAAAWRRVRSDTRPHDGRSGRHDAGRVRFLRQLTTGASVFVACYLLVIVLLTFANRSLFEIRSGFILVVALMVHAIGYRTVRESGIVRSPAPSRPSGPATDDRSESIRDGVIRILEHEKAYRSAGLTLSDVAQRLSVNTKYLSETVNRDFGCNFSRLVNRYRVEEAKRLMADEVFAHWSLEGIALEVGFSNKNTFTRAFKRETNVTPSAYRADPTRYAAGS